MSNGSGPAEIVGKKIFFLYPTAVVQNKVFEELVQQEYEVYMARDHLALGRALKQYPDSVVFVNINEQLPEKDWETWITGIMHTPGTGNVVIGVVTTNDNEELRHKYIETIGITGGYTLLRSELDAAIKQIVAILNTADAKGRRKYLRAATENETMTTVNLPHGGDYVNGRIKDISVVGLSCAFDDDPELPKNTLFKGIQIKLQSMLLNVEGIVFGSRMDGSSKIYVILFTQRIDPVVRTKIRRYIQQNLQSKMDDELK